MNILGKILLLVCVSIASVLGETKKEESHPIEWPKSVLECINEEYTSPEVVCLFSDRIMDEIKETLHKTKGYESCKEKNTAVCILEALHKAAQLRMKVIYLFREKEKKLSKNLWNSYFDTSLVDLSHAVSIFFKDIFQKLGSSFIENFKNDLDTHSMFFADILNNCSMNNVVLIERTIRWIKDNSIIFKGESRIPFHIIDIAFQALKNKLGADYIQALYLDPFCSKELKLSSYELSKKRKEAELHKIASMEMLDKLLSKKYEYPTKR